MLLLAMFDKYSVLLFIDYIFIITDSVVIWSHLLGNILTWKDTLSWCGQCQNYQFIKEWRKIRTTLLMSIRLVSTMIKY